MNIDIQSLGFPMTDALTARVKHRLQGVMTRYTDRIVRVVLRVGDSRGPRRGANNKFCRVQVYLIDAPAAVIHDVGVDLYELIDRAIDRASRTVLRHLDRAHSFVRTGRAGTGMAGDNPSSPR